MLCTMLRPLPARSTLKRLSEQRPGDFRRLVDDRFDQLAEVNERNLWGCQLSAETDFSDQKCASNDSFVVSSRTHVLVTTQQEEKRTIKYPNRAGFTSLSSPLSRHLAHERRCPCFMNHEKHQKHEQSYDFPFVPFAFFVWFP